MSQDSRILNAGERAYYGALLTFVDTDTGRTKVVHARGFSTDERHTGGRKTTYHGVQQAIAEVLSESDTWSGAWKVRTISTPESIYSDITGKTANNNGETRQGIAGIEATLLSRLGRIDKLERPLVHPTRRVP